MQSMVTDPKRIKLEVSNKRKKKKSVTSLENLNIWKPNYVLLNNQSVKEETKEKFKIY